MPFRANRSIKWWVWQRNVGEPPFLSQFSSWTELSCIHLDRQAFCCVVTKVMQSNGVVEKTHFFASNINAFFLYGLSVCLFPLALLTHVRVIKTCNFRSIVTISIRSKLTFKWIYSRSCLMGSLWDRDTLITITNL